jgi:hypothetical protein
VLLPSREARTPESARGGHPARPSMGGGSAWTWSMSGVPGWTSTRSQAGAAQPLLCGRCQDLRTVREPALLAQRLAHQVAIRLLVRVRHGGARESSRLRRGATLPTDPERVKARRSDDGPTRARVAVFRPVGAARYRCSRSHRSRADARTAGPPRERAGVHRPGGARPTCSSTAAHRASGGMDHVTANVAAKGRIHPEHRQVHALTRQGLPRRCGRKWCRAREHGRRLRREQFTNPTESPHAPSRPGSAGRSRV